MGQGEICWGVEECGGQLAFKTVQICADMVDHGDVRGDGWKDLEIGLVAQSFGLLKLPKMRELKGVCVTNFKETDINIAEIRFKDSNRNKQRQDSYKTFQQIVPLNKKKQAVPTEEAESKIPSITTKSNPTNKINMEELEEDWKEFKKATKKARKHF